MNNVALNYYAVVPETAQAACQDCSLSWEAIGLFNLMGTFKIGVKLPETIFKHFSSDSEEKTKAVLQELCGKGYVEHISSIVDTSNFGANLEN